MDNRFEMEEMSVPLSNEPLSNEPLSQEASRLLNSYLQRACRSDDATVSEAEQAELRTEMSGHILALAAAHQELGSGEEEAMRAALKQFGEAEQIGRELAREIGQRPSILGSPLTVSMIGGVVANWVTLIGADYLLTNTGLDVISPEGHLFGIALGCITGSVIWKRRKSLRQAARWNARFCAGTAAFSISALVLYCSLYSGSPMKYLSWEWLRLALPILLQWITVAGVAGACSGALTGLWCRLVRQALTDTGDTPIDDGGRTLPA